MTKRTALSNWNSVRVFVRSFRQRAAAFACSLPIDVMWVLCSCLGKVDCPFSLSIGSFQRSLQRTQRAFMYGFAAVLCVSALKKRENESLGICKKTDKLSRFRLSMRYLHKFTSHCFSQCTSFFSPWIAMWFDWTRPSVWVKSYDPHPHASTSFSWPPRFFSLLPPSQSRPFSSWGVSLALSFWVNADGFIGISIGPH